MSRSRIALICSTALLAAACSPKLTMPVEHEEVRETIVEREVIHDTVVTVAPDSTFLAALVECNEKGQAQLKEIRQLRSSQRAHTSLSLEENRLEVKTVVDSMGIYLKLKERYKEKEKIVTMTVTETVEVNILHWWQEVLIRVGLFALVFVVLRMSYGLLKPRLNGILTVFKNLLKK